MRNVLRVQVQAQAAPQAVNASLVLLVRIQLLARHRVLIVQQERLVQQVV